MKRHSLLILLLIPATMLVSQPASAQLRGIHSGARTMTRHYGGVAYGGFSGHARFGSLAFPFFAAWWEPQTYLPNYWWVSPYPIADPRQDGYNPNSGYDWASVGALILNTTPPQARVTLNGIYASTADKLGPFQLPVGVYTLRVEAVGYETLDLVIRFEKPGVQALDLVLKRLTTPSKPAPRT